MLKQVVPVPEKYDTGDTRKQILDTATTLFALKGFKAVPLKEIAKEVGIRIASLYYYYDSKDALIEDVLTHIGDALNKYNVWLSKENGEAESLEEVMDNLFNDNFLTSLDSVRRLGMSMTVKEQHNYAQAYESVMKYFYTDGANTIKKGFDQLIEKKIIPPSNTKTLALLFMLCIVALNDIHLHEALDTETPLDRQETYAGLRILLTDALTKGTIPCAAA